MRTHRNIVVINSRLIAVDLLANVVASDAEECRTDSYAVLPG